MCSDLFFLPVLFVPADRKQLLKGFPVSGRSSGSERRKQSAVIVVAVEKLIFHMPQLV